MGARKIVTALAVAGLLACGGGAEGRPEVSSEELATTAMDTLAGGMGAADADAQALACAPTASGADLAGRASPYDSTTIRIGAGQAKICYSRPSLRGRTMIGGEAVPFDTIWRTGANEPTIIHLDTAAEIAGIAVEPGSYSLYTVPRQGDSWTLIVNRSTSQWGAESRYTQEVRAQEVGRADVAAERVDQPIEQFTIRPMEGQESGVLLEWQNSRVRVPIRPAA